MIEDKIFQITIIFKEILDFLDLNKITNIIEIVNVVFLMAWVEIKIFTKKIIEMDIQV